jgi:DNA mismatch repair ATPase MutS
MNNYLTKLSEEIKQKISTLLNPPKGNPIDLDIYSNFKLPIFYLDNKCHVIDSGLSNDLELTPSTVNPDNEEAQSIYESFLQPQHVFGKNIMEKWKDNFTSDVNFIHDSKHIITNLHNHCHTFNSAPIKCEKIINIWKHLRQDDYFLQKYHYMDWEMLKHLNHSKNFLQATSTLQVFSPVVSLMLPILLFIFPFILLKIKNVPITMSEYLFLLKKIAKNHFFAVLINSFENFSVTNFIYLLVSFGFFLFQIYQNISTCKRFYNNIKNINNEITDLQQYLQHSIDSIESFNTLSTSMKTYEPFCQENKKHLENLISMKQIVDTITPFKHSFNKFVNMGQLLKVYYILYENKEYAESFKYSIGFEGYMDNLRGIYMNYKNDNVGLYQPNKKSKITKQYYPIIQSETLIKNDCEIKKNMIISSPNKSGKTTFLKTTLINIILTQQCGLGFYKEASFAPYTHLHCYLNIPDTSGRDSLFQAESRRCKDILDKIQTENDDEKHFCIFDELYSGTNPDEATKAGIAFLKYLENYKHVDFILTTHYLNVCKNFSKSKHTTNYKMNVSVNQDGTFDYHYKIKKGISKIKGATRVLKDMNYPKEIIDSIENL